MSYLKSTTIAEQQYISCLINYPDLIGEEKKNFCSNIISRDIFISLQNLYEKEVSFDIHTLTSEVLKINKDISNDIIRSLKENVETTKEDFEHYKQRVIEAYVKNDVQSRILKNVSSHLVSKGELSIPVLEETIQDLRWAIDTVKQKNIHLKPMTECAQLYEDELLNRGKGGNFLSSGDSWLDYHLYGHGLMKGHFAFVYGLSGVGKSTFVRKCVNGQINKQIPLLYIPNEMGLIPTMDSLVAQRLMIPIEELTNIVQETGTVSDYVIEAFREEKKKLNKVKYFHLVDSVGLDIHNVHELIRDCKRLNHSEDLNVVIDLFTMLKNFKGENKPQAAEDAVNEYFEVLNEEHVASMVVVQARRSDKVLVTCVDDVEKFRPTTEMVKNSGAFEERARQIISVYRPKHYINKYIPNDPEGLITDDIMYVDIQKQNMGKLAQLKYLHDGNINKLWKYEELTEELAQDA